MQQNNLKREFSIFYGRKMNLEENNAALKRKSYLGNMYDVWKFKKKTSILEK